MRRSKTAPLFDHLVGAGEQCGPATRAIRSNVGRNALARFPQLLGHRRHTFSYRFRSMPAVAPQMLRSPNRIALRLKMSPFQSRFSLV